MSHNQIKRILLVEVFLMSSLKGYLKYMLVGVVLGILVSLTSYTYILKLVLLSGFATFYIVLDKLLGDDS